MTALRKAEKDLIQFNVPYRFGAATFHILIMAWDADDAKQRAITAFKRDAYPMDRIKILGAVPHSLVGSV